MNPHAAEIESLSVNMCIARHLARVYGENEARAITKCARKVRDQTKSVKMYELAKVYAGEVASRTVNGKRISGDGSKVMAITAMEAQMRVVGVLQVSNAHQQN